MLKDIQRILKNDSRVLNKLHKRIFMDKITSDYVTIYLSFYLEASNRCRDALPRSKVPCLPHNAVTKRLLSALRALQYQSRSPLDESSTER